MKKLLCLILCLMMILPAAGSLGDGEQEITAISVTVTLPRAGTTTATKPNVTIPAGSPCHFFEDGAYWTDDQFRSLEQPLTFEAGKTYHLVVMLDANDGYVFASPFPQISVKNGKHNPAANETYGGTGIDFGVDITIPFDKVTVSGGTYVLNHNKLTASLRIVNQRGLTKLKIPNTVSANGKTYKVTEISSNLCKGMKKLTTLIIGKYVTKIGSKAFAECPALKKVTIKCATMNKSGFGSKCFYKIKAKATFKVPKKMLKKYKDWIIKKGKAPKDSNVKK